MTHKIKELVTPRNVRASPVMESADRSRQLPVHRWPLWKAVGAAILLYLPFCVILLVIPPAMSTLALLIALSLLVSGSVALIWGRWGDPRTSEVAASFILTLALLAIGLRAWLAWATISWLWICVIVAFFLLAWATPAIAPGLSEWLWREQVAPETRLGRKFLAVSVWMLPAVGVIGATAGLLLARSGEVSLGWFLAAILATASAIAWAQSTSHQLFNARREGR